MANGEKATAGNRCRWPHAVEQGPSSVEKTAAPSPEDSSSPPVAEKLASRGTDCRSQRIGTAAAKSEPARHRIEVVVVAPTSRDPSGEMERSLAAPAKGDSNRSNVARRPAQLPVAASVVGGGGAL